MDPDRTVVPVQEFPAAPTAAHPFLPMGDILFLGAKKGGKSTLVLNMLLRMLYFTTFHMIYFVSPHVHPDKIDDSDYKVLKGLKNVKLYWKLTPGAFDDAKAGDKHPDKMNLIALDDFGNMLKKKECAFVTERFANLRHPGEEKAVMW
jgi:hypothetical protein